MNVQPFSFREFSEVIEARATAARVFTAVGKKHEEVPPPPPPPTFSEEELKAAEREAYKKGFLEGTQEGKKQAESEQARVNEALAQTVSAFAESLAPLFASHRALALSLKGDLPKVAMAIARKVAGAALEQNAQAVIEDVALRACEAMAGEPKLTITVQEKLGDTLERKLQEIAGQLPVVTDIAVVRDATMQPADCRIEWNKGGMERSTAALWQQLEKIIADMTLTATRETAQQMQALQEKLSVTDEAVAQSAAKAVAQTAQTAPPPQNTATTTTSDQTSNETSSSEKE